MPDFFDGNPFSLEKFPPKTEQDQQEVQAFFGGPANFAVNTEKLKAFAKTLKEDSYKKVGAYGYCWGMSPLLFLTCEESKRRLFSPIFKGGKVTISAAGKDTPLDAAAVLHPA
jgi:dienelactone hydrolase